MFKGESIEGESIEVESVESESVEGESVEGWGLIRASQMTSQTEGNF